MAVASPRSAAHVTHVPSSSRLLTWITTIALAMAALARPFPSGAADALSPRAVPPPPRSPVIGDVIVWPSAQVAPGGAVVVSAAAPSGAKVTFDLGDAAREVPMAETSTGRYRGMLIVPCQTLGQEAQVRVRLVLGGVEIVQELSRPVRIVPVPAPTAPYVHVTSPVNEQNVPPVFQVRGRTLPDAEVEVRATFFPRYILGLDGLRDHGCTVAVGRANAQGNFAVPLDLGIVPRGDVIRIETRARSGGQASPTFRYEVQVSDFY